MIPSSKKRDWTIATAIYLPAPAHVQLAKVLSHCQDICVHYHSIISPIVLNQKPPSEFSSDIIS